MNWTSIDKVKISEGVKKILSKHQKAHTIIDTQVAAMEVTDYVVDYSKKLLEEKTER